MREKPLTEFIGSKKATKEQGEKPAEPKVAGLKGPWELPEGWRWVKLGDVVEVKGGKRLPKGEKFSDMPTPYPYLRVDSFENYTINPKKVKFISKELHETLKRYIITSNDVYISIAGSTGIVGIVPPEFDGAHLTENAARLVITNPDALYNRFLMWFLASPRGQEQINENTVGIGQPKLALKRIKAFWIPLPPLEEQKRIVTKLDELNRRLEEAKRLAREAREEAERLIASALHEVFSKAEEKGWEWSTIGKVAKDMKPGFARNKKHISEDGIPHLRPNNIDIGHLNLEKLVKVKLDEKIDIEEYYLQKGDVLFNNTNSFELVGRAALITEDLPWGYSNHITRIRVKQDVILPEWLTVTINYLWMQGYFKRVCTRWVGQAGVNMNTLKKTPVPLPPLEEQKRIVAYLDSINERAQKLVKLYEERERELEQLFPAILDRAFRGEL